MPLEIIETIEQVKADCEKLEKEGNLTEFGRGQLQLTNILIEIGDRWRRERKKD